jgi:hypothetical protein
VFPQACTGLRDVRPGRKLMLRAMIGTEEHEKEDKGTSESMLTPACSV